MSDKDGHFCVCIYLYTLTPNSMSKCTFEKKQRNIISLRFELAEIA